MEIIGLNLLRHRALQLLVATLVFGSLMACERDDDGNGESGQKTAEPDLPHHDLSALSDDQITDLTKPDSFSEIDLDTSPARLYSACHQIFEENGEILPWDIEDNVVASTIFGCNADGYIELEDGRRAIAYEIPMPDHDLATDLRLVVYGSDGDVEHSFRLDRSYQQTNFAANYRGSFLTNINDRILCVGTLWQARTQALCASLESGLALYEGRMDFWAGVEPFAYDGSLFAADLNGITRRYPYSGSEMRHREFGERGGRAGFYATDEERIFFVPSDAETVLSAWDLETLRTVWTAELDAVPDPGYQETSAEHDLLLFRIDDLLYGVDTDDGSFRMSFNIGGDRPPIAFSDDELFLLLRRDDERPVLYSIDPDDGAVNWQATSPPGSLDIAYGDDALMVRSVRTVRTVRPGDELDDD